jgi:Ca2+-binding EF-hand superfamily protein
MSFLYNLFASDSSQNNPSQSSQNDSRKEKEKGEIYDLGSPSSEVSIRSATSSKTPPRVSFTSATTSSKESVVATRITPKKVNLDLKDTSKKKDRGVTFDLGRNTVKEENRYSNNLSLTYKQMEECEEVFAAFETENGTVDAKYLPTMVPALVANGKRGRKPTERELKHLARAIEANGEVLDFTLFLHVVAPYIRRANVNFSKQKIDAAFKRFDIDGNGYITASELRTVLRNCFGKEMRDVANFLDDDDIEEIMNEADLNGDGRISYSEFSAMLPHLADGVYINNVESESLEWA